MKIGKVSETILKRSVLRHIKTEGKEIVSGAGVGGDCAFFASGDGQCVVSCMQEAALTIGREGAGEGMEGAEDGMSIGHLLQKCFNNLGAGGARPTAVMITLLLPEDIQEPDIRALMEQAQAACSGLGVAIAGGQTRICREVKAPWGVVTGFGKSGLLNGPGRAEPGQDIVVSKWIGLEGTAFLARRFKDKLRERYPAYFVEEAASFDRYYSILPEAAAAVKSGVCAMHDASEGGIFAALWELAERAGTGLAIDLRELPLRQETVEVCEYCGVTPYELLSGGCLVMTSGDGQALARILSEQGIPARVVGKITEGSRRIIRNGEEIRYMDRPQTDEIYKIIQRS